MSAAGVTSKTAAATVHNLVHGRLGEQTTAGLVEVARDHVDDLDCPLAKGAVSLRADAHAPVANARFSCCHVLSNALDVRRGNTCDI